MNKEKQAAGDPETNYRGRRSRIEAELLRRVGDGTSPADPGLIVGGCTLSLDSVGFAAPLVSLYRTTKLATPLRPSA